MNKSNNATKSQLREKRLQELLNNCRSQVLQKVIGPFGLTPAMFEDGLGGNVTTQHNASQGVFSSESERYERGDGYDYTRSKKEKMAASVKNGTMNSQFFTDEYTGKTESTKRENAAGKQVMNAEADHTIPLSELHKEGGWMLDREARKNLASEKDNLHFTAMVNNRKKSDLSAEEALSEKNGYDASITQPIIDNARGAVEKHMPTELKRMQYHGERLAITGAKQAGVNALRQALGVLLFEFVQSSFVELKQLMLESKKESLIDRLVAALSRVVSRVTSKLKSALESAFQGGVQGFMSNLLTFVINLVVTTSAKVVTFIREGLGDLWKAVRLFLSPPKELSFSEVCRQVTKIISSVVIAGIGITSEATIKGFFMSVPILVPVADILSLAVTGILTGITTALVIYGIDRFFDWLSSSGTELLEAQENQLIAMRKNLGFMVTWIESQYQCSMQYQQISAKYSEIEKDLERTLTVSNETVNISNEIIETRYKAITQLESSFKKYQKNEVDLDMMMRKYNSRWSK